MNVPSYAFLAFAALVALAINISKAPNWRRSVLIVANIAFFLTFSHDPAQLAPFVGLLTLGYVAVKLVEARANRALFVSLLVAIIAVFCWLKRYAFVPTAIDLPNVYVVVGMSYVFFRILHLVIDAYQQTLGERIGIVAYVNFTLNFTSLVSGPIQFYQDYRRTETTPAPIDAEVFWFSVGRIVTGFFKVTVVSPVFAALQDRAVAWLGVAESPIERILAGVLVVTIFPVFLYINFSGYMDFVVGVARLMGIELPENFNKPFMAVSFIDLWSRWHMTLSNWLKTYVYSPLLLALMKRFDSPAIGPFLGVFVYFVTFLLIGIWHGPTTMFIFYGVLLGLGVSVNKLYQIEMTRRLGRKPYRALCARPWYVSLSRGLTFLWFAFSLLWFWSSWAQLGGFAHRLGPLAALVVVIGWLAAAGVLSVCKALGDRLRFPVLAQGPGASFTPYVRVAWITALFVTSVTVSTVLDAPAPTIVYKAF